MKKLVLMLIIVLLGLIAFFQFKKYTRLNAPAQYDYAINPKVDVNYHDQKMVADYYELAYEIGSFARSQWYNHRIDVLYKDDDNEESKKETAVYNQLKASATEIEHRLLHSATLKSQGFSNNDIQSMEQSGYNPESYRLHQKFKDTHLQFGDVGQDVLMVQQLLNKHGYEIREDGIFNQQTKEAVIAFQKKNKLLANGVADEQTIIKLMSVK